jgi:hypothetical protein
MDDTQLCGRKNGLNGSRRALNSVSIIQSQASRKHLGIWYRWNRWSGGNHYRRDYTHGARDSGSIQEKYIGKAVAMQHQERGATWKKELRQVSEDSTHTERCRENHVLIDKDGEERKSKCESSATFHESRNRALEEHWTIRRTFESREETSYRNQENCGRYDCGQQLRDGHDRSTQCRKRAWALSITGWLSIFNSVTLNNDVREGASSWRSRHCILNNVTTECPGLKWNSQAYSWKITRARFFS